MKTHLLTLVVAVGLVTITATGCAMDSDAAIGDTNDAVTAVPTETLQLKSTTGERIEVTYSASRIQENSNKPSVRDLVSVLRINVTGQANGDTAKAVLVQKRSVTGSCGLPTYRQELVATVKLAANNLTLKGDLLKDGVVEGTNQPVAGNATFVPTLNTRGYCTGSDTAFELAIVMNPGTSKERWLIDPVRANSNSESYKHNFGLGMRLTPTR
jgi:hypothetical protein